MAPNGLVCTRMVSNGPQWFLQAHGVLWSLRFLLSFSYVSICLTFSNEFLIFYVQGVSLKMLFSKKKSVKIERIEVKL